MLYHSRSLTDGAGDGRNPRVLSGLVALFIFSTNIGCTSIRELQIGTVGQNKPQMIYSGSLIRPAEFDAALKENQTALAAASTASDIALYNIGVIYSDSSNPKKDYRKAHFTFKKLVNDYPRSPLAEQSKTWIHVLEERQNLTVEKQRLAEERGILISERKTLSQEREKLNYVIEKSRQIDVEIENKRRQTRTR